MARCPFLYNRTSCHLERINIELKELRSKLRMCNNILEDAERIQIRYNIIRLKDDSMYLPGYLRVYLTNQRILENLVEGAGVAAQKIIKVGNIAELEIPCLPMEKQEMISDIANEQLNIIALYKKIIEQESLRTKSVIKDIFGGKR